MSSLVSGRSLAGAVGHRVVVAVAIGVSVVVIGGWTGRTGGHPAEATVLRGTVNTVNITGTAIGFQGTRIGGPRLRMAMSTAAGWWPAPHGSTAGRGMTTTRPPASRAACPSRSNSAWSKPQPAMTLRGERWWSG
jgi:hypothetical protein